MRNLRVGASTKSSGEADERTALLLEQLLQIARVSALEEMASGMAHELNQPIGAIATFAQAAQRMLDRPEPMVQPSAEVLQHISQEAFNAGEGIRRIRSLFNGRAHGHVECDLVEVITELVPVLDLLAQRRGASLTLATEGTLPQVSIDRLRIQHVLFTLVQNALEAPTAQGEPASVAIEVTGDRYGVRVSIRDRGIGVPDSVKEQLFHPFFTTKEHGTGLGLASSRAIVEAHEGSIGFENEAEGGACFWLRLPAAVKQEGS
jgi:two-component system sensor kinase FixL